MFIVNDIEDVWSLFNENFLYVAVVVSPPPLFRKNITFQKWLYALKYT